MSVPAPSFTVEPAADPVSGGHMFKVSGPDPVSGTRISRDYLVRRPDHADYLDLFEALATDFDTRRPRGRAASAHPPTSLAWRPLLAENLGERMLYGYGDPAVLRVDNLGAPLYYLLATSNDAPDAFPILRSADLVHWEPRGFVFPEGSAPVWAMEGADGGDFWAPELHRVGDQYLLCFTARERAGSLAIGIASASHPEGPFAAPDRPLLRDGVIDSHIFVDEDGSALLLWKEDSNGRWPALLADLLRERPSLLAQLFPEGRDARTAALAAACVHWAQSRTAMERFFLFQPLIEATVDHMAKVREVLPALRDPRAEEVLAGMRTPIFAQRLATDPLRLIGDRELLLVNDRSWEGHLIEGPWLARRGDLYYLFYAGNDFSTADYGIGVAVADSALGPYRKQDEPLLRSSADWIGPGHPSVAVGPDGIAQLFFHAFRPGELGYKAFRALLAARLRFDAEGVALLDDSDEQS